VGVTSFQAEMADLWACSGADSECGRLRSVLMHRPGPELDRVDAQNHRDWLFPEPVDPARLRDQFDALVAAYQDLGVEVHLVEGQRLDRPNALFVRDLLFMTTEGAIVARPGHPRRRGEERAVAATLARMGVPILRTVAGEGTFDAASAMLVNPDVAIVGTSTRTNAEGADQVADQLARMGVRHVLRCTVPASQLHLDGVMAVVDRGLMVVNRWQMPFDLWQALEALDIRVVAVDAPDEVFQLGLNMVAVAPGRVVMSSGYPKIRAVLEHEGVEAVEVDTSEIRKAGGAMHCLTGVIRRDPIG